MIRTIYIPAKEIQVIDLRSLCKRKKQLETIDTTLCPDAIIKVDGEGGEILNTKVKSGAIFTVCIVNSLGNNVGTIEV